MGLLKLSSEMGEGENADGRGAGRGDGVGKQGTVGRDGNTREVIGVPQLHQRGTSRSKRVMDLRSSRH